MKTQIERSAAIYCMLQVANEAMKANQIILINLTTLISKPCKK